MSENGNKTKKKKGKGGKLVKKIILWVIVLALLGGALWLFVLPQLAAGATTTYNTYTASRGTISNSTSFSGTISVVNSETLTPSSSATVRKIYVEEGEKVTLGQRLMRLSNGDVIKAGFDGEINTISVEEDDEVNENTSLIQVVDFGNLQVSLRVDEYSVSKVKVGTACTVNVTALSQDFDSEIIKINRIASGGNTAYYTVTASLTATEDMLPGMACTVTITEEESADTIILAKSALSFSNGNDAFVLMKNDETGEMEQKSITLGMTTDNLVEVTDGLNEGDTVYVVVETANSAASGFASLFSSMGGGSSTSTAPSNSGNWGNRGTGSGGFSGGGFSGGGMPGGGMP